MNNVKQGRAAGSNELIPEIFRDSGLVFSVRSIEILAKPWKLYMVPSHWSRLLIVPGYWKSQKSFCDNYRAINLIIIVFKILVSMIFQRQTKGREE